MIERPNHARFAFGDDFVCLTWPASSIPMAMGCAAGRRW